MSLVVSSLLAPFVLMLMFMLMFLAIDVAALDVNVAVVAAFTPKATRAERCVEHHRDPCQATTESFFQLNLRFGLRATFVPPFWRPGPRTASCVPLRPSTAEQAQLHGDLAHLQWTAAICHASGIPTAVLGRHDSADRRCMDGDSGGDARPVCCVVDGKAEALRCTSSVRA